MLRNSKKNITVSEHNSTLKFPKKGMQKTTFMMDKDKNAEAIKSPLRFVLVSVIIGFLTFHFVPSSLCLVQS